MVPCLSSSSLPSPALLALLLQCPPIVGPSCWREHSAFRPSLCRRSTSHEWNASHSCRVDGIHTPNISFCTFLATSPWTSCCLLRLTARVTPLLTPWSPLLQLGFVPLPRSFRSRLRGARWVLTPSCLSGLNWILLPSVYYHQLSQDETESRDHQSRSYKV